MDIQIFNHPEFGDVRVVNKDGKPLFVGWDVAIALGYSNPRDALAKHVPDKFKRVSQIAIPSGNPVMTLISSAGLYKLVFAGKLLRCGAPMQGTGHDVRYRQRLRLQCQGVQ